MTDYTDIGLCLEDIKNQLLEVKEIVIKSKSEALKVNKSLTELYISRLNQMIEMVDNQLYLTGDYQDAVEDGLNNKHGGK